MRVPLVLATALVGAAILALHSCRPEIPPTDEEQVRAHLQALIDAHAAGEFERMWVLMGPWFRWEATRRQRDWAGLDPEDERNEWRSKQHERDLGVTRDEALAMGPREFFLLDSRRSRDRARDLGYEVPLFLGEMGEIRIDGGKATVSFGPGVTVVLWKVTWFWWGRMVIVTDFVGMGFDRKVSAYLRKSPVRPDAVVLLIQVGEVELDRERIADLSRLIEAVLGEVGEGEVVIDAAQDVPWQTVVSIVDVALLAGVRELCFAAAGEEEYPPGIRVNGLPLRLFTDEPVPQDHPALRRIIGLRGK